MDCNVTPHVEVEVIAYVGGRDVPSIFIRSTIIIVFLIDNMDVSDCLFSVKEPQ